MKRSIIATCEDWEGLPAQVRDIITTLAAVNTNIEQKYKFTVSFVDSQEIPPAGSLQTPEMPTGPWIKSIKFDSGRHITLDTEDYHVSGDAGDIVAKLMVKTPTQPKVFLDYLRKSQLDSRKIMSNAFGHDSHSLNIRKGESITFWIEFNNGEVSKSFTTTWPWQDT